VFAYLVHDNDYRDIDDLIGSEDSLYTFKRHANPDHVRDGMAALGLTKDGDPNIETIFENHSEYVLPRYLKAVLAKFTLAEIREEIGLEDADEVQITEYLEDEFNTAYYISSVTYDSTLEEVLLEMWDEDEFHPGNRDALPLSVYSHGGEVWSLRGEGMRCQWDTADFAGVWVPGESTREHLDSASARAAYAMVRRTQYTRGRGKAYLLAEHVWDESGNVKVVSVEFSDDCAALYVKAKAIAAERPTPNAKQRSFGRRELAEEEARCYLERYNNIISGSVYGCVVECFVKQGDEWEQVEQDACWGFVGSEYAMETLESEYFNPAVSLHLTPATV
jgi:hypothetical protein